MKVIPASCALTDFGAPAPRPFADLRSAPARETAGGERDADLREEEKPDAEKELSARLARAFEDGVAHGRKEAEAAFAEERRRIEAAHAEELAARERQWREETGRMLAERLREGLEELERALGERLADVLAPVLQDAARDVALRRLRDELRRMLAEEEGLKVHVSGPPEMLEALGTHLGDAAAAVTLEPDREAARIVVHVDNTVIETGIAEWAAAALPRARPDEAA